MEKDCIFFVAIFVLFKSYLQTISCRVAASVIFLPSDVINVIPAVLPTPPPPIPSTTTENQKIACNHHFGSYPRLK
ncbi:hypothetical protein DERP_003127 [Dermatophagoides pteronyssinus]|uniref:Secreted protein n=1 Tax=Dermatophagoides pteronyssinus TaxID=6956 RepID=A0ABQ8JIP0_DERPT|nr:hypothetical protein DERP_003127 [Dermatophagoides pteronyssinus]